jgi:hypothetical protein
MITVIGLYLLAAADVVDRPLVVILVTGTSVLIAAIASFSFTYFRALKFLSPWWFLGSVACETVGGIWFQRLHAPYANYVFGFMGVVQLLPFVFAVAGYFWLKYAHTRATTVLQRAQVRARAA